MIEKLKAALAALETCTYEDHGAHNPVFDDDMVDQSISDLKVVIAEMEAEEPDIYVHIECNEVWDAESNPEMRYDPDYTAYYTHTQPKAELSRVWIVVKQHAWDHGDGGRKTLAYLWPDEFERKTYPSFDEASAFIKEGEWPLGWVAMEINILTEPPTSMKSKT